jgi:hypothetical protein
MGSRGANVRGGVISIAFAIEHLMLVVEQGVGPHKERGTMHATVVTRERESSANR